MKLLAQLLLTEPRPTSHAFVHDFFREMPRRLSQNEASLMDPQGRILLEQTGLALADAESEKLFSTSEPATGVYVGVMHMEYIQFMSGRSLQFT